MRESILKLPQEIEDEIRDYTITKSIRLKMLLDKYPLSTMGIFFKGFTKDQLDRVYRYGCVSKILNWNNGYTMHASEPIIRELLKNDFCFQAFTYDCWPVSAFNNYWQTQDKKRQPSRPEYVRRIAKFCTFALWFSKNIKKENFICFCEKLVYDVVVGSLIMRKNK